MPPRSFVRRLVLQALVLLALAGAASGVLATEHNIVAWTDTRLTAGMPGVATDDTLVLPAMAAAGAVLTIPSHIISLTIRGRANYTDLTVKVVATHPGLALTIEGFSATGGVGEAALEFGDATTSNYLTFAGANSLVGGSGCAGLQVPYGAGVTVGGTGSLLAKGADGGAGIGSARGMKGSGTITIVGGSITAIGGGLAGEYDGGGAGIGTGSANGPTGDIAILGGTVRATGGLGDDCGGAGIGLGRSSAPGGRISIRNANVTAFGLGGGAGIGAGCVSGGTEVAIADSVIIASGSEGGAGIGGGFKSTGVQITISDSTVEAEGGSLTSDDETYGGAGIGSAGIGGGGAIRITGGTITARGAVRSAGIGSGSKGGCPEITICDARVTAVGGTEGAGIGTGYKGGCEVLEVSGASIIDATGGTGGAGIGCGQVGGCRTIRLRAGDITATGGAGADDIGIGAACSAIGMRISRWAAAVVRATTVTLTPLEVDTGEVAAASGVETAAGETLCSGSSVIGSRGFVYATVVNPTLSIGVTVPAGSDMGAFAAAITGLSPGTTYHVRAYATNATETAYGEDVVIITPTGAGLFAAFLQEHGLDPAAPSGAADADPDGDGVGNLSEFVLGGDPTVGETGLLPVGSYVSGGGTPVLEYSFVCSTEAAAGFATTVESSTDLATWMSAVDGQGGVTIARALFAGGEAVTVRFPVVGGRLFVRLRVAPR